MRKTTKETPFEMATAEFRSAVAEVQRTRINFNNAIPEFFEIANKELSIAMNKLEVAHKKVKMLNEGIGLY